MTEKTPLEPTLIFQTKSAYAAAVLRKELASGRYAVGERLSATQLARDLGLSMTPVREALAHLAHDGLLEIAPHRGVRVAELRPSDLTDTYVVRAALESVAARLAAKHMQPHDIANLRSVHRHFTTEAASRKPDVARLLELTEEFHFIIYDATNSPLLRRIIRTTWDATPADVFGMLPLKTAAHYHDALIEALEAGDGERAEELMRAHIQESAKVLLQFTKSETKQPKHSRRKRERKS